MTVFHNYLVLYYRLHYKRTTLSKTGQSNSFQQLSAQFHWCRWISCIERFIGVHHTKIQHYEYIYNGLQKYCFTNITSYYKKYKKCTVPRTQSLFNKNNLLESTGGGRKKHTIIRAQDFTAISQQTDTVCRKFFFGLQ